jgi:flagellar motor switch/type III secretory pathway protein FliN
MTVGTIVEFEVPFDSELALQVANRTIGRGQAVKVGENFGLRITSIEPVPKRIDALGGR